MCLEKLEAVVFLVKHASFVHLCEQIHLPTSSGSVECTPLDIFLRLFRNYVYHHFIFPKIEKKGALE